MPANHNEIEKRLWQAADELRANSKLRSSEYSTPVLGLIFLRYARHRFAEVGRELQERQSNRREIGPTDYQARGAIYLPEASRFENLLKLPEGSDIGKNINMAMTLIENNNPKLDGVLPKNYSAFDNDLLVTLLKTFAAIPMMEGDVFGKIYEYFLGEFAKDEGSKGGEFFTPTSLVKLIVEVIEPYHGRIFDPACGSGGMFVQSARFVENHQILRRDRSAMSLAEANRQIYKLLRMASGCQAPPSPPPPLPAGEGRPKGRVRVRSMCG